MPEDPGSYLPKVTLEHLLTMTGGLENSLFFCDWEERYTTKDWIRYFFTNAVFANEPGSQWLYSNFNTYMLSCAIEKRAGTNLLEYLRNRFFEPLGIGNPDWTLCPIGHVHAANGLYVTIDEMANYGNSRPSILSAVLKCRKNKYEEEGYEQGLFIGIVKHAL